MTEGKNGTPDLDAIGQDAEGPDTDLGADLDTNQDTEGRTGEDPSAEEQKEVPADPLDFHDPAALDAVVGETLRNGGKPLSMDMLLRIMRLPRKAKKPVEAALHRLREEGRALRSSGGWSAPARVRLVTGRLSIRQAGMGFVTPEKGPDIYIHPAALNDAWPGDTVEVLMLPGRSGPSREGRIMRVLRRAQTELAARALQRRRAGVWMCGPDNPRIQALFLTDTSALAADPAPGDLLLLRPGEKEGPQLWTATATMNLESENSPAAQERITKINHAIPGPFPPAVLQAVRDLPPDPGEADVAGREDLRDLDFVTIDGRTARDFDDAILVEELPDGFRLRVAIADVSHYVRQDSPLDAEARLRGNSYYFPLSVEPMLPEALSNGLCSLNPGVPRLALVADLAFAADGTRREARFGEAVIRSRARLTYGQIERGLLRGEAEEAARLAPLLPMLGRAEALARLLLARRQERGALDFDLPEAEYVLDEQGRVQGMLPRVRHFGHRLIEECMLAANEAAAEFLEARQQPALYRVHQPPDPDKLSALLHFLHSSGLAVLPKSGKRGKALPSGRDLRRVLEQVRGTPQEYAVTRLLLRSMMQARYQPENEGHFGLASSCYCHFTSPIRRYADLVVHRALKAALGRGNSGDRPLTRSRLEAVAEHINATERTAMDAEREMHKRIGVYLLRERTGEVFDGVVSGVTDFGVFVELGGVMAEGMLPVAVLDDDYYEYLPERQELRGKRTGRTFALGRTLRVLLADVNPGRLEITLALEGQSGQIGRGERNGQSGQYGWSGQNGYEADGNGTRRRPGSGHRREKGRPGKTGSGRTPAAGAGRAGGPKKTRRGRAMEHIGKGAGRGGKKGR